MSLQTQFILQKENRSNYLNKTLVHIENKLMCKKVVLYVDINKELK